jgi:hypothetical protein
MWLNLLSFSHQNSLQLAQIIVETEPTTEAVEDAALVFSGPQFFTALIAGVVLAFAIQLLLTNLGVAAGISLAGGGSSSSSDYEEDSTSFGSTIRKVGLAVGLGTLISVTIALFIACALAVKLSLFASPMSGAIVGLVIWATFFSLMMWLSSTAIGSLLGSVANTATSGMQAILGTATAAFGAKATSDKIVSTAEAVTAVVKRELGAAIDPVTMRENVEDFLQSVKTPELDLEKIAADFERFLDDENLQEIVDSDSLRQIDRETFVQLISDRSDLSQQDVNRIAAKLESVWQKTTSKLPTTGNPLKEFANYLASATKEELVGKDLSEKLDALIAEMRKRRQAQSTSPITQAGSMGVNSLIGLVMGRKDISDLDLDRIVGQLQTLREHLGEQTDKLATQVVIFLTQNINRAKGNKQVNQPSWS